MTTQYDSRMPTFPPTTDSIANSATQSQSAQSPTLRPTEFVADVEIFGSGTFRGKIYTTDDLDAITANFRKLGPDDLDLLKVPVVVGHEEPDDQDFLLRTDIPAAAWVVDVGRGGTRPDKTKWTDPSILYADFTDVFPTIADAIRMRSYRKVSSEIYDNFIDDSGNEYGLALRRVALLGGEIPQVKSLADIPMPFVERMAERRLRSSRFMVSAPPDRRFKLLSATPTNRGTFLCFSEVGMDRDSLIQKLLAAVPTLVKSDLDNMQDASLQGLAAAILGGDGDGDEPNSITNPASPTAPMSDATMPNTTTSSYVDMSRDDMVKTLLGAGKSAADLDGKSDDDLKSMIAAMQPAATQPAQSTATNSDKGKPMPQRMFSEGEVRKIVTDELAKVTSGANSAISILKKQADEAKKATITSFCDRLVHQGKLLKAERPAVEQRLLRQSTDAVHKFTEGGKSVVKSELDLQMAELEARPVVVKFHERVAAGGTGANGGNGGVVKFGERDGSDEEVTKVEQFAELHEDSLAKAFVTREQFVTRFCEARKKNGKKITAESYIGK